MSLVKRIPNFTISEKNHLFRIIANKYAAIIEDKKTNRTSITQKEKAWQAIETEFNASSSSSIQRTASCLKKCYENKKKELRKSLAEERKKRLLTGGGPPEKIMKTDESNEILMSIVNKNTMVGLHNPFDNDADTSVIQLKEANEIEYVFENEYEAYEEPQETVKIALEAENAEQNGTISWKTYTPDQLKAQVSKPLVISEPEENNYSGPNKTPKKTSNRRRPATIVKPLTSSDIAKKYDILLDKRIQLVNGQLKHIEQENALIIRKRQLKIEILEIELAKKKQNINILQDYTH